MDVIDIEFLVSCETSVDKPQQAPVEHALTQLDGDHLPFDGVLYWA